MPKSCKSNNITTIIFIFFRNFQLIRHLTDIKITYDLTFGIQQDINLEREYYWRFYNTSKFF